VEITQNRLCFQDLFAVDFNDDAKHPMGGGVLRAHVEDHGPIVRACLPALGVEVARNKL
jgi:hypothetical protein